MQFFYLAGAVNAEGLSETDSFLLQKLINVYDEKLTKNQLQKAYYENKTKATNLGLAVPPELEHCLETSIGWAAKSVDMLAERSMFDSFIMEGENNPLLDKIVDENNVALSYQMAVPSELIHSCGFWTVAKSDTDIPVIRYFNAEAGAALWDYSRRRILAGFVITNFDYDAVNKIEPSKIVLHTPQRIVEITRSKVYNNNWFATSHPHILGRPCMDVMAYRPTDLKPFGKSRISPTVMSITDEMQRECMRTAISCELYSAPLRYINGIDNDEFKNQPSLSYWTKLLTTTRDEDGKVPEIGQLPTASMQPHIEVMRNLATRMSAESGVPVNEFGILHDQPASAEALKASMESLCMQAENVNKINGACLIRVAKMALAIAQNKSYDDLTDEEKAIRVCWKNPFTPSIASITDAMMKQASISPWLPYSDVYWEALGYNEAQRAKLRYDMRKYQAEMDVRAATERLANVEGQGQRQEQDTETETIKAGDLIEKTSVRVEPGKVQD